MVTAYLLFAAITANAVYSLDLTCFHRLCSGPKFRQSDCCDGFICVALYKPGKEDILECVDEEEHFRVKTMKEIQEEVDREFGEVSSDEARNHTFVLPDMTVSRLMAKFAEEDDNMFGLEGFNNPVIIQQLPNNMTV